MNQDSETDKRERTELGEVSVTAFCRPDALRGKSMKGTATYMPNSSDSQGKGVFYFTQYQESQNKSRKICRTDHCILSQKPDGSFFMSVRFDGGEKYIKEQLIVELRQCYDKSLSAQ